MHQDSVSFLPSHFMAWIKNIPNMLTLSNLFCGALGILVFSNLIFKDIFMAIGHSLFFICLVLDFLDGAMAKLLKAQSSLGVQLDSLADVISFGLYPAIWLFHAYYYDPNRNEVVNDLYMLRHYGFHSFWGLLPLLLPVSGALRLARFNLDTSQKAHFKGLPIPAMALAMLSLPYFTEMVMYLGLHYEWFMALAVLSACGLMLSRMPILNLKFDGFDWSTNWVRYLYLLGCLVLVVVCLVWLEWSFYHLPLPLIVWLLLISILFRKKILNG